MEVGSAMITAAHDLCSRAHSQMHVHHAMAACLKQASASIDAAALQRMQENNFPN